MNTVLVTGTNGLVASHILEQLMMRNDVRVIAACRGKAEFLPNYKGEVREGDLRDESYLNELLKGVNSGGRYFSRNPDW